MYLQHGQFYQNIIKLDISVGGSQGCLIKVSCSVQYNLFTKIFILSSYSIQVQCSLLIFPTLRSTMKMVTIFWTLNMKHANWRIYRKYAMKCRGGDGGLIVSVLDSGSSGPGWGPDGGTVLCSWARHLTLTVPLFTQVYRWVLENLLLGVTLRWTSIPSRGSRNTPRHFMLQKPG